MKYVFSFILLLVFSCNEKPSGSKGAQPLTISDPNHESTLIWTSPEGIRLYKIRDDLHWIYVSVNATCVGCTVSISSY